jgi:hypothetical protein
MEGGGLGMLKFPPTGFTPPVFEPNGFEADWVEIGAELNPDWVLAD